MDDGVQNCLEKRGQRSQPGKAIATTVLGLSDANQGRRDPNHKYCRTVFGVTRDMGNKESKSSLLQSKNYSPVAANE